MARWPIDVVYVHYRVGELLERSVASVRAAALADDVDARVLVVDNGAGLADVAPLARLDEHAAVLPQSENRGFGAGCNAGAAAGEAPLLLFLNPDTLMFPGVLAGIVDELQRHRGNAILGPRHCIDPDRAFSIGPLRGTSLFGPAWDALDDRGWLGQRSLRLLAERMRLFGASRPQPVRAVAGAALAIGRTSFARLGGFDEGYFLYAEDTDLCVRAGRVGLPVLYLPWLSITHFADQSARQEPERAARARAESQDRFLRMHHGPLARRSSAALARAARWLPRRGGRAAARLDDPRRTFGRPGPPAAAAVLEVARSPLFDNGVTAAFTGPDLQLPTTALAGLAPGRYFVRTAFAAGPGRWRESGFWCFEMHGS